jgi:hypothetical protein
MAGDNKIIGRHGTCVSKLTLEEVFKLVHDNSLTLLC